ncbi:PIR Superfamily Protein [Plasmodium ovale wallikeri]|uniref:PIR Superfamily Protein n=1 Tax=Plasmodium ovale wallikeri TaxID=864142 RepID=A0A1A9AL66_PLAOA|nr:PIR Superfamily Protein [Plasmodium ovale wallikeri]SBT56937.1 PIR Superfamily Protein [Plasmodium ovale wallikeri]
MDDLEYIAGDDYYSSVNLFHKYKDEFDDVNSGSRDTNAYGVSCSHINTTYFAGEDFGDRCYKVAKYLDFIKKKNIEDIYDRCRYLNYLINSNNEYNNFSSYKISKLFEAYNYLASTLTICNSHIEHIKKDDVLQRITKLNNLYEALNNIEKSQTTQVQKICTYTQQFATQYENSKDYCRSSGHPAFC